MTLASVAAGVALTPAAAAQTAELTPEIKRLLETFNDENIPFNEKPLILGPASAKVTAILFYAPTSEEGESFMRRVFPAVKQDFIDKGKLRLIVMDYPLDWKDVQVLAGLRCVPEARHLEAVLRTAQDNWTRWLFKIDDFTAVPRAFTQLTSKFGLSADDAIKCMRNLGALGFIEGSRRLAEEQWGVQSSPALAVGREVLKGMNTFNPQQTIEFLRKHGME